MPGTRSNAYPVRHIVEGHNNAAVTASLFLKEFVAPCPLRIGAVVAYATTAGTGAGNTVIDVLKNGTSVWGTATDRPTLLATATGEFANAPPTTRALAAGDRLAVQVASVSTTGHGRVAVSVALELT